MIHWWAALLTVVLLSCSALGGNFIPLALALLLLAFRRPVDPVHPMVTLASFLYALLQLVAVVVLNIMAAASSSMATTLFDTKRTLLLSFGVPQATNDTVGEVCAATIPQLLTAVLCIVLRSKLRESAKVSVPRNATVALWWVLSVGAALAAPSLIALFFLVVALLLLVALALQSAALTPWIVSLSYVARILGLLFLAVVCAAQNEIIIQSLNIGEYVGLGSILKASTFLLGVCRAAQVILGAAATIAAQVLRAYGSRAGERSYLLEAGVPLVPPTSSSGSVEKWRKAIVHAFHLFVSLPVLPLMCVAATIIVFECVSSAVLLLVVVAGIILGPKGFSALMPWMSVVVSIVVVAQYCATSGAISNTTVQRALLSSQTKFFRSVQVLSGVFLITVFGGTSYSYKQSHTSATLSEELEERETIQTARGKLTPEKTSYFISLLQRTPSGDIHIAATFRFLVGRAPSSVEQNSMASSGLALEALYLEECAQLSQQTHLRSMLTFLWLIFKRYSSAFALLFLYCAATAGLKLDVLHGVLLLLFVGFLCFFDSSSHARYWSGLIGYMMILITIQTWCKGLCKMSSTFLDPLPYWARTTIGIDQWETTWAAFISFLALFVAVAESELLKRSHQSLGEAVLTFQWNRLARLPSSVAWQHNLLRALVVIVFMCIFVFESKSILVGGLFLLLMLTCALTVYSWNVTFWWALTVVYSAAALLLVSLYQFPEIREKIDSNLNERDVCKEGQSCQSQIGFTIPQGTRTTLALFLAPWFIALVASYVQLRSQRLVATAAKYSVKAPEETEYVLKFVRKIYRVSLAMDSGAGSIKPLLMRFGEVALWTALFVASTSARGAPTAGYALALIFNLPAWGVMLYSGAHLIAVYSYQFTFVPELTNTHVAAAAGLDRTWKTTVGSAVVVPMIVFLVSLFAAWAKTQLSKAPPLTDGSWSKFFAVDLVLLFGYEIIALVALLSFSASIESILSPLALLLIVLLAAQGRCAFYSSSINFYSAFAIFSILFVYDIASRWNSAYAVWSWPDWHPTYFYPRGSLSDVLAFSCFVALASLHTVRGKRGEWSKYLEQVRDIHEGFLTLPQFIVGKKVFENLDPTRTAPFPISFEEPRTTKMVLRPLILFFAAVMPVGVLTFADGARDSSFLNTALMISGVVQVGYRDILLWKFSTLWGRIVKIYLLLPLCCIVLHVPVISDWAMEHQSLMQILGFVRGDGSSVLDFAAIRVALFWVLLFQSRLFDEFSSIETVRAIYDSDRVRRQRHEQLVALIRASEAAQLKEAAENDELLNGTLEKIRRMPRVLSTSVIADAEREPLVPKKEGEEPSIQSSVAVVQLVEEERNEDPIVPLADRKNSIVETDGDTSPDEATNQSPELKASFAQRMGSKWSSFVAAAQKWVIGAIESLIAFLISHSFSPNETLDGQHLWEKLATAILLALQKQTDVITFAALVANFAAGGTLWDMIPCVFVLSFVIEMYPWAPLRLYQAISLYVFAGILLKGAVHLLCEQLDASSGIQTMFQWLLGSCGETSSLKTDLLFDFLAFIAVTVHLNTSTSNGLYAKNKDEVDELRVQITFKGYKENITRRFGTGEDLYTWYLLADAVSLLAFLFGYYSLAGIGRGSIAESVQENMLPGALVLVIILSLILMLVDRGIYAGSDIRVKFVFHVVVCAGFHIAYVWWMISVNPPSKASGITYFCFKAIYFYISARQIRAGFPRAKDHDPFTQHPDSTILATCYSVFRAIPLLWELRVLTDWVVSRTSLTLDAWLKVEELIDVIYSRRVMLVDLEWRKTSSRRIVSLVDAFSGGIRIALILLVLFFPLAYYSTFNPSMRDNAVTQLGADVDFGTNSAFFASDASASKKSFHPELGTWLSRTRPILGSYDLTSSNKAIQLLEVSSCSSELWTVSPQALRLLNSSLVSAIQNTSKFSLNFNLRLSRAVAVSEASSTTVSLMQEWNPPYEILQPLLDMISSPSEVEYVVMLKDFYSPIIFNQPSSVKFFTDVTRDRTLDVVNCSIKLRSELDYISNTTVRYWCLKCNTLFSNGTNLPGPKSREWRCLAHGSNCDRYNYEKNPVKFDAQTASNMYFVAISEKVPQQLEFLPNVGIIAIYTTFVLAFGRILRSMFADTVQGVFVKEMKNPRPLERLLSYLLLARTSKDLELERSIYVELIALLRSPEKLYEVTAVD